MMHEPVGDSSMRLSHGPVLHLTVCASGCAGVAIEIAAARMLAPFVGVSTLVWAMVIGATLACLALGYALGGRLADRRPQPMLLALLLALAACGTSLIPLLARPFLLAPAAPGLLLRAHAAVLFPCVAPLVLIGACLPLTVRLRLRAARAIGDAVGALYASSTIGSLAGAFLPTLMLIPRLGTYRTFQAIAALLAGAALLVGVRAGGRAGGGAAASLMLALILALAGQPQFVIPPQAGELLYEGESTYNYIRVVRGGNITTLQLNAGNVVQSIYAPDRFLLGGYWDMVLVSPYFGRDQGTAAIRSLGIIGLAGGTVARQFTAIHGPIPIDGVEIDPQVVAVGRRYFALDQPNLRVSVEDGRRYLQRTERRYDLLLVDAYRYPYIPFHLTTVEFFRETSDHLTEHGVITLNVVRPGGEERLSEALAATLGSVFPSVYTLDVPGTRNQLVIATKQPTTLADFTANLARLAPDSALRPIGDRALAEGNPRAWDGGGLVLTDNRAPIELLVDQDTFGRSVVGRLGRLFGNR